MYYTEEESMQLQQFMMDFMSIVFILVAIPFLFVLTVLLKLYTGKSLGDPSQPPTKGTVFHQILHFNTLYDHQVAVAREHPTYRLLAVDHSEYFTADTRNIEHILKSNFQNYVKGDYLTDIFKDMLGFGIFAVDGGRWRQQRKLASFEFSTRVLRDFSCGVFRRSAAKLVDLVSEFAESKQLFDIDDLLTRYSLDSIFKVGFGVELNCLDGSNEEGAKFVKAFDEANVLIAWRFANPFWKLQKALNVGAEATMKIHVKTVHDFINRIIKSKRMMLQQAANLMEKGDILSRLLIQSKENPDEMNDEYLRDIILNFTVAGKDSTSITIAWFIYALCRNPFVQIKIVQEMKQVFPSFKTHTDVNVIVDLITEETLNKLHYLHAALSETIRLYPAIPVDGRSAVSDDVLPDGHKLKAGDRVSYIAYAMARMPYIWGDNAEEFIPERWLEDGVFRPESPFKFISFHAGPRMCLGKDFAYRQMKIVMVALMRFFEFRLADREKEVRYKTMLTLHLDGGLHVYALPRKFV